MAFTNTITANMVLVAGGNVDDVTKEYYQHLQTSGSATTQGSVHIFGTASASDDFILENVCLSFVAPTASVEAILYVDTSAVATLPTMAAGVTVNKHFNFGPGGIMGGTTTTATVSVVTSIGTSTVSFFASGYRKQ